MSKPVITKFLADTSGFSSSIGGMVSGLIDGLASIHPGVAAAVSVIGGIGAAAFQVAQDFDAAFDKIAGNTNATGAELEGLQDDFKKVFGDVPDDADKVSTAIVELTQKLGLSGEPLQEMTKDFLALSEITGEDVPGAIDASSKAFHAFGVQQDQQREKLGHLYALYKETGVSVTDLAKKAADGAGTFQNLGLSFEESTTLIAGLEKATGDSSGAMAGLTKAVANMTAQGIPAKDALQDIIASIKDAPDDTAAASAALEIFGAKAGPELAQQIRSGKFDLDQLTEAVKKSEADIQAAAKANRDFGEAFDILDKKVSLVLLPLGTFLMDGLTAITSFLLDNFQPAWDLLVAGFDSLVEFITPVIQAIADHLLPVLSDLATAYIGVYAVIWEKLGPILEWLWNNVLSPFVAFLRDTVVTQIEFLAKGFGVLWEAIQKIPGVTAAMEAGQKTLGTATAAATGEVKKQAEEAGKATGALKTHEAQTKKNVTATRDIVKELAAAKEKTKETKVETFDLEKAMKAAESAARDYDKKVKDLTPSLQSVIDKSEDLRDVLPQIAFEGNAAFDAVQLAVQDSFPALDDAKIKAGFVEDAYRALGIKSAAELSAFATEAETHFNTIKASGSASATEIDAAWIAMMTARQTALAAQGLSLPAEEKKLLDKMLEHQAGFKESSKGVFTEWAAGVKSITDSLSTNIIDGLFTGDLSFGGKVKPALLAIKDSFVDVFKNEALSVITGPDSFVTKGLNVLTGALDGLIAKLTGSGGVKSAFSSAFDIGGGGIPGVGGGPGGGSGGALGSAFGAGAAPWLTAGASVVSAVSDVVGNFQMGKMNDRLFDISGHLVQIMEDMKILTAPEGSPLWTAVDLQHSIADRLWDRGPIVEIRDLLNGLTGTDGPLSAQHAGLIEIRDTLREGLGTGGSLESGIERAVRNGLNGAKFVADGREIGELVLDYMARAGANA